MINLKDKSHCICKDFNSIPIECINSYKFSDSGKSIQLKPKNSEKTVLIAIDKCVIADGRKKCDCLFIHESKGKTYTFLVELKGKNHIENAFDQLSKTREYSEYQDIINQLEKPINKYAIVSDVQLDKLKLQKLENTYNIRVGSILFSEPCSKVPDLKSKIHK